MPQQQLLTVKCEPVSLQCVSTERQMEQHQWPVAYSEETTWMNQKAIKMSSTQLFYHQKSKNTGCQVMQVTKFFMVASHIFSTVIPKFYFFTYKSLKISLLDPRFFGKLSP
jgi:hypothetical protein